MGWHDMEPQCGNPKCKKRIHVYVEHRTTPDPFDVYRFTCLECGAVRTQQLGASTPVTAPPAGASIGVKV
jgi:hypothetical protein